MKEYLRLALYKAIIRHLVRKLFSHMLTDVTYIERLQISEVLSVKYHKNSHHLTIREATFSGSMTLFRGR